MTKSAEPVAALIDISAVRTHHDEQDVRRLADLARSGGFINAHVLPHWVPLARELLAASDTLVGAPAGFPGGGHATSVKVAEARWLVDNGVQEMDLVVNVGRLRSGDDAYVSNELGAVRDVVPASIPLKVILEVGVLDAEQIGRGARLAADAGADFIKTGTGWTGIPARIEDVRVIREAIGERAKIKVAGGIRDLETVTAFRREGVARFGIGVDHAVAIAEEQRREWGQ